MAANLSPEFKEAQEAYRRAREPQERLECLREMLRTIPKHKGTEHLQADLKTRIKEQSDDLAGHRRGGARTGPSFVVRSEGAAQVALLGPPNSGKSLLHARLTGSHSVVGPYPFATKMPLPGMLSFEDIHFQLVDLPPIAADYVEPWIGNAVENADAALLILDLGDPGCVEQMEAVVGQLEGKRVSLVAPGSPCALGAQEDELASLFRIRLPAVLVANKADLLAAPEAELLAFRDLTGVRFPTAVVSAETGHGLAGLGPLLFDVLGIVRVYTKVPGHPPEAHRPFTLWRGSLVRDVARLVHRGRAAELHFARVWGSGEFDGQQVSADHPVRDRDIVELHW
ncbi:MAG TPA: GTPase [Vicinamibacteria bacterium]|nr:GTPase [Vicinamibacteria bacterium]